MDQKEKARAFKDLHISGKPLVLFNVWDAGSAQAVAKAGAKAIATGSWSVAAAQGYSDGEQIPLSFVEMIASRIAASVDLPVSIDFEGGYAAEPEAVADNVQRILETGAVGINFEDQVVTGEVLYTIKQQSERLSAIRLRADAMGIPMVINARTDLFLQEADRAKHAALMDQTMQRADAYANAGASSFFVPGLVDIDLIETVCANSTLPVNVMASKDTPPITELAQIGVARISHGPGPYAQAHLYLKETYCSIYNNL